MKIFLTLLLLSLVALSFTYELDAGALKLHDEALERSFVSFGLAKGLNAVISMIQGTQLSVTPLGVGLNISVGEILDPFNDMVERFSWVMLISSISLGIEKLLLSFSSKLFVQVLLVFSASASLLFIWVKKLQATIFFGLTFKILYLFIILRFAAMLFVYSSDFFYHAMLEDEYVNSNVAVEKTKVKLDEMQNENQTKIEVKQKEKAWYELDIAAKYNEIKLQLNIAEQLRELDSEIENASKNIINLITIFVVQNILMPILFIWFLLGSIRLIFKTNINYFIKSIHL